MWNLGRCQSFRDDPAEPTPWGLTCHPGSDVPYSLQGSFTTNSLPAHEDPCTAVLWGPKAPFLDIVATAAQAYPLLPLDDDEAEAVEAEAFDVGEEFLKFSCLL